MITTASRSRTHPVGLTRGTTSLIGAWLVGLAIVRLTGAAAVLLLLVASFVAMLAGAVSGWWRLRSLTIVDIVAPGSTTAGDEIAMIVDHRDRSASQAPIRIGLLGTHVTLGNRAPTTITLTTNTPGVLRALTCELDSTGIGGLVRWRRREIVPIDALHVAPRAAGPTLPVANDPSTRDGTTNTGRGPKVGELDGTRLWRPGEGQQAIHWASTLRAGEVIAHDRTPTTHSRWSVSGRADAAQVRWSLEEGLRRGHEVLLTDVAVHSADPDEIAIADWDDALVWSAIIAARVDDTAIGSPHVPVWKRQISFIPRRPKIRPPVPRRARLLTSGAAIVSLWMLLGALGGSLTERLVTAIGVGVATAMSMRFDDGPRPWWAKAMVLFVAVGALARIAMEASGVGGLLEALRGPMPDLLLLLVVLHGAEIADRRTSRVHLAITGVVVAYAAGLRIDGRVGWWMLAWGVAAIAAFCALEIEPSRGLDRGTARRVGSWAIGGVISTIAIAAFVPIPDGPASLGLPALSNDNAAVIGDGALVGPDGKPTSPSSTGDPSRGALGQVGGYPGFSDTLDTAVRGDLGDEIVMRVRAPEPAFWRGQTFSEFDGRVWRVSDASSIAIDGPHIDVPPTLGDRTTSELAIEDFVQTFNVEADLPNVIFAAAPAETLIFDGSISARSDGAMRADRTLQKGTVYSVVSRRIEVTAETLRAERDLGDRFAPFADAPEVAPFLALPETTSRETIDLATRLRVPGSTYDTVRAYEDWMATNTAYDLDAPVPDGDAVDDFLFHSQRGFCEQIASSLVIMLRSQGVPARLATGYIPGTRNQISGVFEVRASDAHAWVEVWFPDSGWQAFDPTASVPLSGDARRSTVGADAASAMIAGVASHPVQLALLVLTAMMFAAAVRWFGEAQRRRARGAWGLLHDRFMALAPGESVPPRAATRIAERVLDTTVEAHRVALTLDRVAFDPDYAPDDETLRKVAADVTALERAIRSTTDDPKQWRREQPLVTHGSADAADVPAGTPASSATSS